MDQDTIDAINQRRDPGLTDRVKMAHEMATQLTTTHRLTDSTYAEAEQLFGEEDRLSDR